MIERFIELKIKIFLIEFRSKIFLTRISNQKEIDAMWQKHCDKYDVTKLMWQIQYDKCNVKKCNVGNATWQTQYNKYDVITLMW